MPQTSELRIFRFGDFELDESLLELRRADRTVHLQPKPLRLLQYLVENRDRVVSKEELLQSVWADVVVSDSALSSALRDVRGALEDDGARQQWVRTQRGRGYRMVGAVEVRLKHAPPAALPSRVVEEPEGPASPPLPFIGRSAELARLMDAWSRAREGGGGVALVTGEPGIGKTRLLDAFGERVRAQGGLALAGRCLESDLSGSYTPFRQALGAVARSWGRDAVGAGSAGRLAALARLFPQLHGRGAATGAGPVDPDQARRRLWEAISRMVREEARRRPVLLVVDDLHWGDADTRGLLAHLARGTARDRVLVCAACMAPELDRQAAPWPGLAPSDAEAPVERIDLGGFCEQEVGELAHALAGRPVSASLARWLAEMTAGNPLFVREVLVDLFEPGAAGSEAGYIHAALALLPGGALDRPRTVARLARTLVWSLRLERATEAATQAATLRARTEGEGAARTQAIPKLWPSFHGDGLLRSNPSTGG